MTVGVVRIVVRVRGQIRIIIWIGINMDVTTDESMTASYCSNLENCLMISVRNEQKGQGHL